MKQFNLEEYLKNPLRKVVTRKGIPVKIHCTNFVTNKRVIAEIDGRGYSQSFFKDGRFVDDNYDSSEDLFFAPEKHEGWINIHRTHDNLKYVFIYDNEEEARRNADESAIATIKIEWEE